MLNSLKLRWRRAYITCRWRILSFLRFSEFHNLIMLRTRGSHRRLLPLHRDPSQLLPHFGIARRRTGRQQSHKAGILGFLRIRQLSGFDTDLGSEIPIDKTGDSRPAESLRHQVVAPPGHYACDDG